jgi:uncharacterized protein with PQ loop repeat
MMAIGEILSAVASLLILSSTFPQAFQTMRNRMTWNISMRDMDNICSSNTSAYLHYRGKC